MAKKTDTADTVKLFSIGYRRKEDGVNGEFREVDPNTDTPNTIGHNRRIYYIASKDAAEAMRTYQENHSWYVWRVITHRFEDAALRTLIEQASSWQDRERARFEDGTYKPLPWAGQEWFERYCQHSRVAPRIANHFAHVSTKDPQRIAYTASLADGIRDKQTLISPSLYLYRFFDDVMPQSESEKACAEYRKATGFQATLGFAKTAEEIVEVYRNGPRSCMSHSASNYDSDCHPVEVYGDSDLQLAYAMPVTPSQSPVDDDDDEDDGTGGKYCARALVWPAKKLYGRVYGHAAELKMLLEAEGYTFANYFEGARLPVISNGGDDDDYVMPYVDVARAIRLDGKHWIIDKHGDIFPHETNGVLYYRGRYSCCERCDRRIYEDDDCAHDVQGMIWCDHCTDYAAVYCESDHEYYPEDDDRIVQVTAGRREGRYYRYDDVFECEHDGETYHVGEMIETDDGSLVANCNHEAWLEEHGEPEDTEGAEEAA